MEAYRQRVVDEKKELDDKIEKLQSFLSSNKIMDCNNKEKGLLMVQLNHMINYSSILGERISGWF